MGDIKTAPCASGHDECLYVEHAPIDVPVGPWECIDRACEQYEDANGNDLPDVAYCSHVTVLVLCAACSGASENHALKYEVAWGDCTKRAPERVKHSGPDTKFCVLCLSGEHERAD